MPAGEDRRGSEIPVERILSITGQILLPENGSAEVQTGQVSALEQRIESLSVGDHRGVAPRTVQVPALSFGPDRGLPFSFSIQRERQDRILSLQRTGQKDGISPNDGCGTSLFGQGRFPLQILLQIQFRGVLARTRRTRGILSPPGRPIFRSQEILKKKEKEDSRREGFHCCFEHFK